MPAFIDLTNQPFGRLTVIERAPNRGRQTMWRCLCDPERGGCGNKPVVHAVALRAGATRSCGCRRQEKARATRVAVAEDLTDRPFYLLTVTGRATANDGTIIGWRCICACGNEKLVAKGCHLLAGRVRSCGCCSSIRDLATAVAMIGKPFGLLTVIGPAPKNKRSLRMWRCRCKCGEICVTSGAKLRSGEIVSCGCARGPTPLRPEAIRVRTREDTKRRYRTDVTFALNRRVRNLLRVSLKKCGIGKSKKTEELLGRSLAEIERHLRWTMPVGHTWDDFLAGRLHIDHIVALKHFNITSEDCIDFKRAWALSNLRLLPKRKNLQKGARLEAPFQPSLGF